MPRIFKNLFDYTSVDEVYGNFEFFNITLRKVFPDELFCVGDDVTKVILNPLKGTVCLENMNYSSKEVSLKEWIEL